MNIGKSIRKAIAENDMKQHDLSAKSGISQATISGLVTGKTQGTIETISALAKAVDMSVSEFVALGE